MIHLKGTYYNLYADMLEQTHLLIGGKAESGKTTIINALLTTVLIKNAPSEKSFILLDPKGTALWDYCKVQHTLYYGSSQSEIIRGIDIAKSFCDKRLRTNRRMGDRIYHGSDIYLVIDDMLALVGDKQAMLMLQQIINLGAVTRVHVIAASRNSSLSIIPLAVKEGFTAVCALKTEDAKGSQELIGYAGCEDLPSFDYKSGVGYCKYKTPLGQWDKLFHVISKDEIKANLEQWLRHKGLLGLFRSE